MAVAGPRDPGASPVVLLRELQDLIGAEAVARWCADLLAGRAGYDDPQLPPLGWFGTGAANALQRGDVEARGQDYWVRTWAARGLLHGWDEVAADVAVPAIVGALHDDAWRVREMAAKVVRRWKIHDAAAGVAALANDDVPRVRAAGERARTALADAGSTPARGSASRTTPGTSRANKAKADKSEAATRKKPAPQRQRPVSGRRTPVSVDDLESAVSGAVRALRRGLDLDWSLPAGTLSWDCRATCAHVADDLIAYSAQLAVQVPSGYLPFRFQPARGTSPAGLLSLVEATGAILAAVVRAAPADARGFHPYGMADGEGFTTMGIAEVLLHTHDIATGLGLAYEPAERVCEKVVTRLCREAQPAGENPWSVLLWATGRGDLPGREPVKRWRWWPAPAA